MGIRTNDKLGGTIGGDTTGTEKVQDDESIKRGLDVNLIDPIIEKSERDDVAQYQLQCTLTSIEKQLKILNLHMSVITNNEIEEGDIE